MTMDESVSIRPIDKTTINQICSGQVVLTLATAVKELLENSIDAGSTSIQIKLDEYGSESIEVIDNGSGVEEANFQALTLKHHTSKISEFADVYSVETFGFRGEALSSLCTLSNVTITTQHKTASVGAMLKFDHNGIITSHTKTHRKVGTTVKLENLFCTLPIRRTEFLKNLKREFSKMCNVLFAYGLLSTGIRITCTNSKSKGRNPQEKKGLTTPVMDSKGESIESNISCLFGVKQRENLLKIVEKQPTFETLAEFGLEKLKLNERTFQLEGYVSSCCHGCGMPNASRQFYYINSRPVDNPKISKLVNEVYHKFNVHQEPFVVLNVKVIAGSVDVNVTPDKRQILVQNEKILLATLKESLLNTFEHVPSTLRLQNVGLVPRQTSNGDEVSEGATPATSKAEMTRGKSFDLSGLRKFASKSSQINSSSSKPKDVTIEKMWPGLVRTHSNDPEPDASEPPIPPSESLSRLENLKEPTRVHFDKFSHGLNWKIEILDGTQPEESKCGDAEENSTASTFRSEVKVEIIEGLTQPEPITLAEPEDSGDVKRKHLEVVPEDEGSSPSDAKRVKYDLGLDEEDKRKRKEVRVDVSLECIKRLAQKARMGQKPTSNGETSEVKFRAKITPQSNAAAESELDRVIQKDSFARMDILGQFNLGFVITKLDSDLFIIDQHASDEKYNFETLRATTVMQTQKMVSPETLELPVDKEELMVDREEVFKKNGFGFTFDESGQPTKRIKLTSIPLSKNIVFGKDDVHELLFMLEDAPENAMFRPSRVELMFASRACRKSVMIGTALNRQEMRKIVDHMGQIEQPWNCPHGRPTMRHLVNLDLIFA